MNILHPTGWKSARDLVPDSMPLGTSQAVQFIRNLGYSSETHISDDVKGNETFNATALRLVDEEVVFRPWTTTYNKAERMLVILFTEESDAVMFRLMNA